MPPISFGKIDVNLTAGQSQGSGTPESSGPFRVAVLGDFSGRSSRGLQEPGPRLANRRPLRVDRDNFDEVLAKLDVQLHLPGPGGADSRIVIPFRELDDFHPDRIYRQVEAFASLRKTRTELTNPATFAATAARVRSWTKTKAEAAPARPAELATPAGTTPLTGSSLLEQLLGESSSAPSRELPRGEVNWDAYLQDIIAPYLVPKADPQQAELVAQVDGATAGLLRAILHHPDFQALEAAWRSLYFLIRRLDTDGPLQLFVLDVTREELGGDLGAAENLAATGLYRLLVEQTVGTPGGQPWALITANFTFGPGQADVEQLGRLAKIAQRAGAPFLAGASPEILGCRSLAETPDPESWQRNADSENQEAWRALRNLPEASFVGLALPRFLLRLPYGKETDPIEAFDFQELPESGAHAAYLWGNPAFAWTELLGETFNRQGWEMRPGTITDIDGLPLHVYQTEGEAEQLPCAETLLTMRAADAILDHGLMPLLSVRGSDRVRLGGFRSIAAPPRPLAGRWG